MLIGLIKKKKYQVKSKFKIEYKKLKYNRNKFNTIDCLYIYKKILFSDYKINIKSLPKIFL